MTGIAIVGFGHWGPNHARVFDQMPEVKLLWIVDPSEERRSLAKAIFPNAQVTTHLADALHDKEVEGVVIAAPTSMHADLVRQALNADKHVLCEKPLTTGADTSSALLASAAEKKLTLMCGHIFLHNPGIIKLKEILNSGVCGPVRYITATRTNLGPFRYDVNAAWDLASHDLYIFSHLLSRHATAVSCHGGFYLQDDVADVCFLNLKYEGGITGQIHASWLSPSKVREIVVVCEEKMIRWNELEHEGPIKIYDSSVSHDDPMEYGMFLLKAKYDGITIPPVNPAEPLKEQNAMFLKHMADGSMPTGTGADPLAVVAQLNAADESLRSDGRLVPTQI